MLVDESLARGLREGFWGFINVHQKPRIAAIAKVVQQRYGVPGTTKEGNKLVNALSKAATASPVTLHHGQAGKNKGAAWFSLFLEFSDEEESRTVHGEPVLRVSWDCIPLFPRDWNINWLSNTISQHCVQRMFQRLPWSAPPTATSIFPELKELVLLMPWYQLQRTVFEERDEVSISLFLPTSHGAFLGQSPDENPAITEIKTFISLEQMRPNQLELWQLLRDSHRFSPLNENLHWFFQTDESRMIKAVDACDDALSAMRLAFRSSIENKTIKELIEDNPSLS